MKSFIVSLAIARVSIAFTASSYSPRLPRGNGRCSGFHRQPLHLHRPPVHGENFAAGFCNVGPADSGANADIGYHGRFCRQLTNSAHRQAKLTGQSLQVIESTALKSLRGVCDSFAGLAPSVRAYGTKQRRDARGALEADRIIPSLAKPKRRNGGMTTAKKSPKLLRRLRPAANCGPARPPDSPASTLQASPRPRPFGSTRRTFPGRARSPPSAAFATKPTSRCCFTKPLQPKRKGWRVE